MGLDYTDGCVNFRDAGEFINLIAGKNVIAQHKFYRGGSIDYIKTADEIAHPKSIFNLRNGVDPDVEGATNYHFPMANKVEKYDTSQKEVQKWLNGIIGTFENPEFEFPVLIHCLSGKDRTGIVIATILLLLGIDRETIIEEYLLSEGEVKREYIEMALDGLADLTSYFNRIDLEKVKAQLLKT